MNNLPNQSAQAKSQVKVPDLPAELYKDQIKNSSYSTSNIPPFFSTTTSVVTEKQNCDPSLLRSTMYVLPTSEYSLETSGVPLVMLLTPFSERALFKSTIQQPFCKHCRSFFGGLCTKDGPSLICGICNKKSEAVDFDDSPSMEIQLPNSSDEKPVFVFVFDLSCAHLVRQAISATRQICQDETFKFFYENVAFISVSNGISIFEKSEDGFCVAKILAEIPFVSKSSFFKTGDSENIEKILAHIEQNKDRQAGNMDRAFFLLKDLAKHTSGMKVAVISSAISNLHYEDYLVDLHNISFNIFRMSAASTSNSLERVSFYTSGTVFKYTQETIAQISVDLFSIALSRPAFNVSIALKTSDNLVKANVVASTINDNLSKCKMNHMDPNTTVAFWMSLNGMSKNTKNVQVTVNFVDYDGSKKIRVMNHSFPVGTPQQFFSSTAFDVLFAALVKASISDAINMEDMLVRSLVFYRTRCSQVSSSSQFVLPESLKCLPVLLQSCSKLPMDKARVVNFTVEETLRYFYPRLFSLTEYALSMKLSETRCMRLQLKNIVDGDIYIMENSFTIYIYVTQGTDEALVSKLFSETESGWEVRKSKDEESVVLSSIISEIMDHYNRKMNVVICLAGKSQREFEFLGYLVEDALNNCPDYLDFVFKLHFRVQKNQ